jgi:hypothetical protein
MAGTKPQCKALVSRENVYIVYYSEVGAGWNVKNDGISFQLHSLPVDGKLVLFPRREDEQHG